ncbi:MAG: hypothetical protein IJU52_00100 [Clostridia bacterium]|nr:hypothetical protein [Clostridia bacterium]
MSFEKIGIMPCRIETKRLILFPFTNENLPLFVCDRARFEKEYGVSFCGEALDYLLPSYLEKLQKKIEGGEYLFYSG